ncbi:replicative DNA helicase [Paraburkholderia ginsengisoli]|uniref:Replicative DNA helicase n=1 Tax=Paraburkholderia ginsengisoli TaxID=311231 RepID=A0A7T4T8L4_9BURK|nr:replicative DNA helicase [Paraburkholderia ginsengisoli]QQC63799.1 replicative DNA helicase [Paraburkholderia ginsengisoli]
MTASDIQRAVPHSLEAEQSVLGSLLIDNDSIDRVGDLRAEHFYRADHRMIFEQITTMIADGGADVLTAFERLQSTGKAQQVGGLAYLNALAQNTPGSGNIARYAAIVRDRAQKRGLLAVAHEIQDSVGTTPDSAVDLIDKAAAKLEILGEAVVKSEPVKVGQLLVEYLERMQAQEAGLVKVHPTGLTDLDLKLGGGLNPGDLVVVAARPAMGKTAFSLALAAHGASQGEVLFLSLEMPNVQLQQRLVAAQGRLSMNTLRNVSGMSNEDWARVTSATERINEMGLFIDFQADASLLDIRGKARAQKRKHGLSLLVVDYLGLMSLGDEERHDLKIGTITRGLKILAKELDCPVVLLSQLNRGVEQRPNKRPMMSDLKDSGSIEADADTILFLYRDEVYNPDSMDRGKCEVIIAKQRQGETGTVGVAFIGEQQRFEDLAHGATFGAKPEPKRRARGFD